MAVAADEETIARMNKTIFRVCEGEFSFFFSGEVEGDFCPRISVVSGNTNNGGRRACARRYCPVCRVSERTKLQLAGVCSHSKIDRFYLLKSPSELLGMTFTKTIFSSRSQRWEIVDRYDEGKIFAFSNQSAVIPLGKHRWYFQDESCEDLDLNLHREVEKPGHFCCDDGSCIDSELVCNNFPDCQDGTDETNCSLLIQPPPGYKKHLP